MIEGIKVRESHVGDQASIDTLYSDAFPDEDLRPLVKDLLQEKSSVLSLVGMIDQTLAGHVMFTICGVSGTSNRVALLAPLAVTPAFQRRGIGTALVRDGFQRLVKAGITQVYVLGDPAYYMRFGFKPDDSVTPPYPLPQEWQGAWQSVTLQDNAPRLQGKLSVPQPWQQPALWMP